MVESEADARAYDALSQHPRLADLTAIARASMAAAVEARRSERDPERVARIAGELKLVRDDAGTPFGNALDVLERGPEDDAERALACALAAHTLSAVPPADRAAEEKAADDLLWLATHTAYDATGLLDRALGERAATLWDALAERVRRVDAGKGAGLGRGEALVAAVAIASSKAKGAARQAGLLALEVRDRKLARVLGAGGKAEVPVEPVLGQVAPVPRGPGVTAALAITGILFVLGGARLLGRLALAYRKPAELTVGEDGGVRVKWRVELLGRTLRDREVVVPRAALIRATREVRYPGIAIYAGLLALAIGSWIGVSAFVDGVRAASPSLLASGLVVVALGLALDFALSSLAPGARGRCRVLLVSRDGVRLCLADVEPSRADALLARLSRP
jgi:hypothetical protein